VAEACTGPSPPEFETTRVAAWPGQADVERSLGRATDGWATLPDRYESGSPQALAADALMRLRRLEHEAGRGGPIELDRQIRELIAIENELERRLGELLCAMSERRAWNALMFAGVRHYGEQRLGMSRATTERRARLARALKRRPLLRAAYESGRVGLDATLLVVQILGSGTVGEEVERAWVDHAARLTIKRLRDEARALGRLEPDAGSGLDAPRPMTDEAWHDSLAFAPGELRGRVLACGVRAVEASGSIDVFLGLRLPVDLAVGFGAAIEAARRHVKSHAARGVDGPAGTEREMARGVAATVGTDCDEPPSHRAARDLLARGRGVPAWVGLLALLEDFVMTWDDPKGAPRRRADKVYSRDGYRCTAPCCTSRSKLESHHPEYRSRGGDVKALWNQTVLCQFHHRRGEHGGLASVRGKAPLGLVWRLGREDLGIGVWYRNEAKLAAPATA
jgi:hypothetical protein